jgi:ribosomal protein S18 acetylase RimI-like enzyme
MSGDPATITVRPATAGDLDAILPLALGVAEQHRRWDRRRFTTEAPPEPDYRAWIPELIASDRGHVLVAEGGGGGGIVGYAVVQLFDEAPHEWSCAHGYLMDIGVAPGARRAGVGQRLVAEAARWARARGVRQVRALTAACNDRARNLLFNAGFRPTAVELSLDMP